MVQHLCEQKLFSKRKQAINIIPMADIHRNLNSYEKIYINIFTLYSKYL